MARKGGGPEWALFTSERQPSGAAKSRGKRQAINARKVALEALRGAEIIDPEMRANLRRIFPKEKKYYGYHVVVARLYNLAEAGNIKAIEKILKITGELDDRPTMEVGGNASIHITTASDKGRDLINDLMHGDADEQGI